MIDNELARNGSGYYDETAYKAYMSMAKPGEIWTGSNEEEYLIIQQQSGFANVLRLVDNDHPANICIAGRYTNPAMLHYLSQSRLGRYVGSISRADYTAVIKEMRKRLTFVELEITEELVKHEPKKKSRKQLAHELLDMILEGAGTE